MSIWAGNDITRFSLRMEAHAQEDRHHTHRSYHSRSRKSQRRVGELDWASLFLLAVLLDQLGLEDPAVRETQKDRHAVEITGRTSGEVE